MSEKNTFVISATNKHLKDVIYINTTGFPDYMNTKMGNAYALAFFSWFLDDHSNENGIHLISVTNNKITGYAIGARIGYQNKLNKHLLVPAALGFLKKPYLLLQKKILKTSLQKIKNVFIPMPAVNLPDELKGTGISLVGISVHPEFRGQQIGGILLNSFEKAAIDQKYDYLRLTVKEQNTNAISLYTKHGWKLLECKDGICSYYKRIHS